MSHAVTRDVGRLAIAGTLLATLPPRECWPAASSALPPSTLASLLLCPRGLLALAVVRDLPGMPASSLHAPRHPPPLWWWVQAGGGAENHPQAQNQPHRLLSNQLLLLGFVRFENRPCLKEPRF